MTYFLHFFLTIPGILTAWNQEMLAHQKSTQVGGTNIGGALRAGRGVLDR